MGVLLINFVYWLRLVFSGLNVCDIVLCKNECMCVVYFSDLNRYCCECGDWFMGNNCEGKVVIKNCINI